MLLCPQCGAHFEQGTECPHDGATLVPQTDDPLLGQRLGPFRVTRLLGAGGMGRVYLGVQPDIGSRVAIKVLAHDCANDRTLVERFFAEARVVNLIRHEHIVNVIDLSTLPDGRPYIVMEYLDGDPLSSVLRTQAPLPLGVLARLLLEVLSALEAAHRVAVIHRDLKPDNIFVTPRGHAKVLDFGIAKLRPDEVGRGAHTRTGSLLGTPQYMSPEQAMGREVDLRTDVYAVGIILYQGATGHLPIRGSSLFELLTAQVEQIPLPPSQHRPDLPPALESVILRALAKDRDARFPSAAAFAEALEGAVQGLGPEAWSWPSRGPGSAGAFPMVTPPHPTPVSHDAWAGKREPSSEAGGSAPTQPLVSQVASPTAVPPPRSRAAVAWTVAAVAVAIISGAAAVGWSYLRPEPDAPQAIATGPTKPPPPEGVAAAPTEPATPSIPAPTAAVPAEPAAIPSGATSAPEPESEPPASASPRPTPDERPKTRPAKARRDAEQAPAPSPEPPEPAPKPSSPRFEAFDVSGFIPQAQRMARNIYDDAVLVRIDADGVRPDGRADLTLSEDFSVLYRFNSPSRAGRPPDLPLGVEHKPNCKVYVVVEPSGITAYPLRGWACDEPPIGPPRCSAKGVWAQGIAQGAPASNAVAELGYWAGPEDRGRWHMSVDSFSAWITDRCGS